MIFRNLLRILSCITLALGIAACYGAPSLPQPPLTLPFDTQTVGFKIGADIRVVDFHTYIVSFRLGFKEGDPLSRAKVRKLVGEVDKDKYGNLLIPGIPISIRIRIVANQPSDLETKFEKIFEAQRMNGCSAEHCYSEIVGVKLKPGRYRIEFENIKKIPELRDVPLDLSITAHPKSNPISD